MNGWSRMMKNLLIHLSLGLFGISSPCATALTISSANADDLPTIAVRPVDGKVEASIWSKDKPTAKFYPTDANGVRIAGVGWPKERTDAKETSPGNDVLGQPLQPPKPGLKHWSITLDNFPTDVQTGQEGEKILTVPLKDVTWDAFEFGQQLSEMSFESTSKDPLTGEYTFQNIFGVLAADRAFDPVDIPLLFGDTNGDGEVGGPGDLLYGLVDLRLFLAGVPNFSSGQFIALTDGTSIRLPGMMFSTAPFTFDSGTGFAGTPFTGAAYVAGEQDLSAVPEPATLGLTAAPLILLGLVGLSSQGQDSLFLVSDPFRNLLK